MCERNESERAKLTTTLAIKPSVGEQEREREEFAKRRAEQENQIRKCVLIVQDSTCVVYFWSLIRENRIAPKRILHYSLLAVHALFYYFHHTYGLIVITSERSKT